MFILLMRKNDDERDVEIGGDGISGSVTARILHVSRLCIAEQGAIDRRQHSWPVLKDIPRENVRLGVGVPDSQAVPFA